MKVIWANDPFQSPLKTGKSTEKVLGHLIREGSKIQPVYILSPDNFNFTGDFSGPWVSEFKPKVEAAFKRSLARGCGPFMQAPKILINKTASLRGDVKKLVGYASRNKSDLIVLNTHGRSGLSRLVLGSFAETAMLLTKTPLLMVNPQAKNIKPIKKVLFPTDLSTDSKRAFRKSLKLIKAFGAEVIIYHKLPDPIEPMVQSGVHVAGGGWVSVYQYLDKEAAKQKKACQSLVMAAKKAGVKATAVVDDQPGFVTDSIIDFAEKKKVNLVALSCHTGPVASVLIGSVSRQLVRQSQIPVLIVQSRV